MARKESITITMISEAAFSLAREEGFEQVTARKLAARIGCSTQPIFRVYANMEELNQQVFQQAISFFDDFYENYEEKDDTPFVHLGLAYIDFAMKEKKLFQLLFLSSNRGNKSLYELLNGRTGAVGKEIARATELGCKNSSEIFMKMWIFIHGAACMGLTDDYDLTMDETLMLLKDTFHRIAGI